ncbi:hypothetical protein J7E97_08075 [Streptomyces sp. ISL-66]|uniref:DUF7739 domain-containing protein n=1 Tax=Streptomyces sp. ISL-66 TaxID=2819186 RepID=UPI001BED17D7|nr:hypothetical protein [Streptomyces sp. ISL-66]MBT2467830.1 hypothetical protein [Streptomyces sp. ISL-66]
MGWSISHGGTRHGYSYGSVAELRAKLEKAAPQESATLSPVLNCGGGDPFKVNANTAQHMGAALHRAADRLKIWDRKWAAMARQIGDSALLAAKLGEPWSWS